MIRAKKLSLVTARRTLRALYAQTQGYPYAAKLAASGDYSDNTKNQTQLTAFGQTNVAQILPGAVVAIKGTAETVDLADDADAGTFGLCANFVGGDLDEIGDLGEVGVWRGPGSVWIVLSPVFDISLTGTTIGAGVGADTSGGAQGVIGASGAHDVGALLNVLGANAIVVDLRIP